jgi:hypothetical protein
MTTTSSFMSTVRAFGVPAADVMVVSSMLVEGGANAAHRFSQID